MRTTFTALTALLIFTASSPGSGQQGGSAGYVRKGRELAILVCANCHAAASSQPFEPILQPPAPSFESIARRKDIDADWVQSFLATTHRGLDNPNGMPNPRLLDSQIKQMAAYLLSPRENP
jgi:mono/diheme cytochrome c family protein